MLDSETKKRIDTARDILVGKIPDPKSQIEQITIALIYKFMDDMDKMSEEQGGYSTFFTENDTRYSWSKLLDPAVSGVELVNLYGEAIQRMNHNLYLPQLFRDIFKNAYLPYRDPETLKQFLRIIDDFKYDHSERLGDAFEYLLSVMGSQGDAGQFRTPRHIIEFIVDVVDPSITETILDPACGTADFLISAYKHILDKNTDGNRITLTPDQRKKLAENIVGYDIFPDMVRLSLVNLYLHGFKDPHIYEYDALTSDEKWNETYDVCLANPPFMTSKGGIKPHNRFSVKSNRSEVLFVDYIHEHLNNDGRAGIVVPEGIIFQSGKAYKDLRKTLIDNSLYAVVSLPTGVFNPYSGVKTSILFLDKRIAKKSSDILFVKVEADGFNLGAQRKEIEENDLPVALKILQSYQKTILEGGDFSSDEFDKRIAHIAPKEMMKEQGWNLSGDKYKEELVYGGNWDLVELGDERYFKIESGGTPNTKIEEYWNGDIKWVTLTDLPAQNFITEITDTERTITNGGLRDSSAKLLPANSILISSRATIGRIAIAKTELATNQEFKNIIIKDFSKANEYFIAYMVSKLIERMNDMGTGGTFKEISKTAISSLKIPLPPLNVQEELVEEINKCRNIIDGAKKVIENYKPSFKIDKNWELVKLGKIAENLDTKRKPVTKSDRKKGQYPYYGASGIVDYVDGFIFDEDSLLISEDGANLRTRVTPIAFSVSGKIWVNNHAHVLKFKNKYTQIFVELYLNSISLENYITGSAQPKINRSSLNKIQIPLPDSDIQQEIVSYFEEEQKLIDGNKKLIEIFEEKIIDCISEVWKND